MDAVVYDLVNQAKQQPWYENTLFVVVSDHGHFYPAEKYDLTRPERFHIPLFMFGGALKDTYRGEIISEIVSQVDLVNTLARSEERRVGKECIYRWSFVIVIE